MFDAALYNLTQSLWGALAQAAQAVAARQDEPQPTLLPLLGVQAGRAESPGWFLVQAAEFDPEPLTIADLRVRDIYASARIVGALLDVMTAEKWFDRRGEAYHLAAAGREQIQRIQGRRHKLMGGLEPLPPADMERLESLCRRVIDASLDSPDPPGTWCLAHSRHRAPAEDAPIPLKLFQYVADFNAFRDDAHMAAWRPYGIAGYAWEAFSLVAGGGADSAVALFAQLAYRGYSIAEYADALEELARRGWLTGAAGDAYQVTENGRIVRDRAEKLTDEYFFASWQQALSAAEMQALPTLLEQLREALVDFAQR